ncbi:MAG: pyridoxal phosphate-dependent aminotransferase [Actinomycetes bacterium]
MPDERVRLVERMRGFGATIFAEMSALAVQHDAVNLGQGFPDTDGPAVVLEAAKAAIDSGRNQYPPGRGIPELLQAVSHHQKRFYGIDLDPQREVLVTAGATEAIAAAVLALAGPGDDVVVLEPFYDSYAAVVALAGARLRPVTLHAPEFELTREALEAAVTPQTRVLLLNTPHNPTGRVLTREELQLVADVCVAHDLVAVVDEVYEHLVYDGEHHALATFGGMWERTLKISSAAKTFSVTGWKVGWVTGPRDLVDAVLTVKQFLTFVNAAPLQPAVAVALALPDSYFDHLRESHRARRDLLASGLRQVGLTPLRAEGTYFQCVDVAELGETDALDFCRRLPGEVGVAAVPVSVFYQTHGVGRTLVRFAFCKREEVIAEAVRRLEAAVTSRTTLPA